MDRRRFLTTGLALGCSAAASPLLTPVSLAAAPWDQRLVVIILRGGMDGLDVVRPVGDPDFAAARPRLADGTGLPLDNRFALHPLLEPLMPLWQAGELGAVQAVSTPYRDKRSHFDGQDLLEAGIPDLESGIRDGWLNRMLQTVPGIEAETAFAVGREQMLILSGDAPMSQWSPEARLRISPQARQLLELVHHDDPLFREASADAIAIAEGLAEARADDRETAEMMEGGMMMQDVGSGLHTQLAEFAASRLRGDTRIASFSINGWDTHQRQFQTLDRAIKRLRDTLLTLRAGLGPVWGQTAVLCLTEFGRTVRENGNAGTDHGTGGAMIYAGGALRGGRVLGDWPGLSEAALLERRDLMPTGDVRAYAAHAMAGLFGIGRSDLEGAIFPGLQMGADPGLVL